MKNLNFFKKSAANLKAMSLFQQLVLIISTFVPVCLVLSGFGHSTGAWHYGFAAIAVLILVITGKKLVSNEDLWPTIIKTAILNAAIATATLLFWAGYGYAVSASATTLNFALAYILALIGSIGLIGIKEANVKTGKAIVLMASMFFLGCSSCIAMEGVNAITSMPAWVDTLCDVVTNISISLLIICFAMLSIVIWNTKTEREMKWCKRFGALSVGLVAIGSGLAFILGLLGCTYPLVIGRICMYGALASMILCGITGALSSWLTKAK